MLYAALVRVSLGRNQRRINVIVEAEDLEKAKEKAVKQARKIYNPGKKTVYTVVEIVSETEALENLSKQIKKDQEPPPENPDDLPENPENTPEN